MIAEQGITFDATPEAIKYLAEKGIIQNMVLDL